MMHILRRKDHGQLRQYLLGDVAPYEQKTIEQRLLTNAEYFDELVRIEEELTDQYAAGELDPREQELFEARFMHNAERREGVEFAQALRRYAEREASTATDSMRSRVHPLSILANWRAATAICGASVILVLAAGLIFLGRQVSLLRHQYEALRQEHEQSASREAAWSKQLDQERAKSEEIRRQLQQEREEREKLAAPPANHQRGSTATVASLTLLPGLSRTAEPEATVTLSATMQDVRLMLESEAGLYRKYVIEVQTAEGTTVWKQTVTTVHRAKGVATIAVTLPAPVLSLRDYLVLLAGENSDGTSEHLATYNFTVLRR